MVDRAVAIVNQGRKFPGQAMMRAALQLRTGKFDTNDAFAIRPRSPQTMASLNSRISAATSVRYSRNGCTVDNSI